MRNSCWFCRRDPSSSRRTHRTASPKRIEGAALPELIGGCSRTQAAAPEKTTAVNVLLPALLPTPVAQDERCLSTTARMRRIGSRGRTDKPSLSRRINRSRRLRGRRARSPATSHVQMSNSDGGPRGVTEDRIEPTTRVAAPQPMARSRSDGATTIVRSAAPSVSGCTSSAASSSCAGVMSQGSRPTCGRSRRCSVALRSATDAAAWPTARTDASTSVDLARTPHAAMSTAPRIRRSRRFRVARRCVIPGARLPRCPTRVSARLKAIELLRPFQVPRQRPSIGATSHRRDCKDRGRCPLGADRALRRVWLDSCVRALRWRS